MSTSYCHYNNRNHSPKLISIEDLKVGIFFAMKENLMVEFVYPDYELPTEYKEVINTIDHGTIVPSLCKDKSLISGADVIVIDKWEDIEVLSIIIDAAYVLRTCKVDLFAKYEAITPLLDKMKRLNIVITDVEDFTEADFETYNNILSSLSRIVEQMYVEGKSPQLNLLTDRMVLDKMNNCNAGWESIALAPDGRFYVCPAFYHAQKIDGKESSIGEECERGYSIGDLELGLDIKNPQLYRLDYAKLCRDCDAYQCKRCIWLNRKTTFEVSTPSHEQCVVANIERNASKILLNNIRQHGEFLPNKPEIKEIRYLDPFESKKQW